MPRREGRDDDRRVKPDSIEQARRDRGFNRHGRDRDEDRDGGGAERIERDREPRYEPPIIAEEEEPEERNHSNAQTDRHIVQHTRGYELDSPSNRRGLMHTTSLTNRPSATTRTSTTTLPQLSNLPSLLSHLGFSFASIPVSEYDTCRKFILESPEILEQNPNLFLREAAAAHRNSKFQYARSCVQQALLISKLKNETSRGRRHFFEDLANPEDLEVLDEFLDSFDTTIEAVQRSAGGPAAHAAQRPTGNVPVTSSQALGGTTRRTHNENPLPAMSQLNIQSTSDRPRYNPSPLSYHREVVPQGPSGNRHHRTSDPLPRSTQTFGFAKGTTIRGGQGNRLLDPNYTKRRDAKKFFRIGRVFALLWHEPAGGDGGSATSFLGENVYSNIRRMAVVRDDIHGACWAIPIHTYGKQGIAKRGFNQSDHHGHAIIYMTGTSPTTTAGEPEMIKKPIQVNPAQDPNQELDPKKTRLDPKKTSLEPMSRINFTKVHTVEHEVKVLNIGTVSKASMPDFERYWAEQTQTRLPP